MTWLILAGTALVMIFSFVILFGAPFLPTLSSRKADALKLLDLKPGQTLVELGSGDGRMLRAAAQQGVRAIGYELNPLLVLYSKLALLRYRGLVSVRWGNYWRHVLPPCDGIYVFLLDPYMSKLHKKITQEIGNFVNPISTRQATSGHHKGTAARPGANGVRVVSFAFKIPGKRPVREINGMYLYLYKGTDGAE